MYPPLISVLTLRKCKWIAANICGEAENLISNFNYHLQKLEVSWIYLNNKNLWTTLGCFQLCHSCFFGIYHFLKIARRLCLDFCGQPCCSWDQLLSSQLNRIFTWLYNIFTSKNLMFHYQDYFRHFSRYIKFCVWHRLLWVA